MNKARFMDKIENALTEAKIHLLYFFDKDNDYAIKMAQWFAEVSTKNHFIHASNKSKETVGRPRKKVYWLDFGVNVGTEFNFPHFCVVIKEFSHTAIVIPISSEKEDDPEWKKDNKFIVPIGCIEDLPKEKRPSYALVNQIQTVSKQRLSYYKDTDTGKFHKDLKLTDPQMDRIDEAIRSLTKP